MGRYPTFTEVADDAAESEHAVDEASELMGGGGDSLAGSEVSGAIPFDPAVNHVFAGLKDGRGVTRGATCAALCTTPNRGCRAFCGQAE